MPSAQILQNYLSRLAVGKTSFLGGLHGQRHQAIEFFTQTKVVTLAPRLVTPVLNL
ncbi:MAG: hypothetical protein KME35_06650 [Aphanocapsa sp. GSE-SYN-MK-11-07L]|jgi:hypothetical protein|nr:hypothetical protein [Aphanocapsa sp. GSE-SYN-MK-11-07L]